MKILVKYKCHRFIPTVQLLSELYFTSYHWLFQILTKLSKYLLSVDMIACNQFGYYTGPSQALLWFVSSSLVLWLFELASVLCLVAKLWRIGCVLWPPVQLCLWGMLIQPKPTLQIECLRCFRGIQLDFGALTWCRWCYICCIIDPVFSSRCWL